MFTSIIKCRFLAQVFGAGMGNNLDMAAYDTDERTDFIS